METEGKTDGDEAPQGDEQLGYRNVDEEEEHDERGTQGPGPEEPPPRES